MSGGRKLNSAKRRDFFDGGAEIVYFVMRYPILSHTVFKYAGSARLTGKSGGCGT
jgi:hypothetical protein